MKKYVENMKIHFIFLGLGKISISPPLYRRWDLEEFRVPERRRKLGIQPVDETLRGVIVTLLTIFSI